MAEWRVHAERSGREGAHAADVDAHFRLREPAHVGVEAQRAAPNGFYAGDGAQEAAGIGGSDLADAFGVDGAGRLKTGREGGHLHALHARRICSEGDGYAGGIAGADADRLPRGAIAYESHLHRAAPNRHVAKDDASGAIGGCTAAGAYRDVRSFDGTTVPGVGNTGD